MSKYDISKEQLDDMKHAIGFRKDRIKGRKHLRYEAYRNYYATREGCDGFEGLINLVNKGLMISRQDGSLGWIFHVPTEGFKFLSEVTGVKITQSED